MSFGQFFGSKRDWQAVVAIISARKSGVLKKGFNDVSGSVYHILRLLSLYCTIPLKGFVLFDTVGSQERKDLKQKSLP